VIVGCLFPPFLFLAVLEAIFVWFDNDEEACGMDAMEEGPNSGGKSAAAATPRQSSKVRPMNYVLSHQLSDIVAPC
jgi:hypothetical protein